MSELMLDVDQAVELKNAFRRGDWTNAEVKQLCEGNLLRQVREVVRGLAEIIILPVKPSLELLGTVTIPATTNFFLAGEHFVKNVQSGALIKIDFINKNCRRRFFRNVMDITGERVLQYYEPLRDLLDIQIIDELGGRENVRTNLSDIYHLVEKQPNGEKNGVLLTDGRVNIFYVVCLGGIGILFLHWNKDASGWFMWEGDIEDPDEPEDDYAPRQCFDKRDGSNRIFSPLYVTA